MNTLWPGVAKVSPRSPRIASVLIQSLKVPPRAIASPAEVAWDAPHAPNASPCEVFSFSPSSIAAINVETANSPEPRPIKNAPCEKECG